MLLLISSLSSWWLPVSFRFFFKNCTSQAFRCFFKHAKLSVYIIIGHFGDNSEFWFGPFLFAVCTFCVLLFFLAFFSTMALFSYTCQWMAMKMMFILLCVYGIRDGPPKWPITPRAKFARQHAAHSFPAYGTV